MARTPKNPPWGIRGQFAANGYDRTVVVKNAGKRGLYGFRGGLIRNLGVATVNTSNWDPASRMMVPVERIVAYGHTQVSNGASTVYPAMGFVLDVDTAEQLTTLLLGAIAEMRERGAK